MDDQGTNRARDIRFRKLRIAWSIVCATACALLIALWVRSYWHNDVVSKTRYDRFFSCLGSDGGTIYVVLGRLQVSGPTTGKHSPCQYHNNAASGIHPGFAWRRLKLGLSIVHVPHWFFLLLATVLAAAPWIPWRFSFRTMLVAMTVVAALLGAVVWAVKRLPSAH
jgi:hypothetical protein